MRGFLGGLAIGLVTVVLGVVALTLLAPTMQRPDLAVDGPVAMGNDQADEDGTGVVAATADNDLIQMAPKDIADPSGEPDTLALLDGADTTPADKPVVLGAPPGLTDPGAVPGSPEINVEGDVPVAALAPSSGLNPPRGDGQPGTLANPVQPVVSDGTQAGTGFGSGTNEQDAAPVIVAQSDPVPSSPAGALRDPALAPAAEADLAPTAVEQSVAAPETHATPSPTIAAGHDTQEPLPEVSARRDTLPTAPVSGQTTAPTADQLPVADNQSASAPVDPAAPGGAQIAALPLSPTSPSGVAASVPDVDQSDQAVAQPRENPKPPSPQTTSLPQAGSDPGALEPNIGTRVTPLTKRNAAGVGTIRLAGDPTAETTPEAGGAPESRVLPPLQANGETFENPDNRPLMAIVLIDDGTSLGIEALADFPYPVSFAIDPGDPEAAAKMARHRAAGFEVVLIADLPRLANAQDAETSLSVWLNDLPDVVAVLEGTGTGIQGNRDLSAQVTAIVDQRGLGLIMQARGLNTAFKLAARDGVPAGLVFRDFDGAGQTPVVMRRFLDQAAFRAGQVTRQNGGVIMLGRLHPDTISTLVIWGLQDRAGRVAVVPVSAVLKAR
ncbi:MAG: divergent polysaccharide deacetylase family protein [Rhodobacteraceae bacterium]|nr:divergent polysaccharide deacetylase family protein [Paracoccaceae bacterium]